MKQDGRQREIPAEQQQRAGGKLQPQKCQHPIKQWAKQGHHEQISDKRDQPASKRNRHASFIAAAVKLRAGRKEAQKRLDDAIADDPAQGIAKQIIHVKQPITAWINEVQPAGYGEHRDLRAYPRRRSSDVEAAAKVITQVDAEGDGHHDVEQHLKQRTVMQQRKERKWLIRRCFFHDVRKKMKRDQLGGRPAHQFDLLHGGQRQDHEKICAQQIQYKRIDDQDPHGKH